MAFGFYEDGIVNCSSFVEEFLILALPYTVTCSTQCKGLCSVCGQNLNTAMCECIVQEPIDSRFAALKDIKLKH